EYSHPRRDSTILEDSRDMKIVVAGGDGFCGWPTALYLSQKGHEVTIVDNLVRRDIDDELGSNSVTPILPLQERVPAWKEVSGKDIAVKVADLTDYEAVAEVFQEAQPEAFVHFAEHRSAPYSMIDREHAIENHRNNIEGTLNVLWAIKDFAPDCHLVKLGTMGEYGQPNIDIEEGWLEVEHKGRKDRLPYPKQPGSFYHPRHRSEPGRGLRPGDRRDPPGPAPGQPLRLRRRVWHRPEPLHHPGGDRPRPDRLRQRLPDPRVPGHPGHGALHRDRL